MSQIAVPEELVYERRVPRGLAAWFTSTNHKHIGLQYITTAFVFFVIAAGFAMVMRAQTMRPDQKLLSPETYNQLFSMHGTTMIFLFAMPMLIGLANYLVPLMIGAEDMAFPRLNAFSYWVFLTGGLLLYASFFMGGALDTGWFSYAPLTERSFSPHDAVTVWTVALALLGISSLAGAVNFIITMRRLRAPGMTWLRMPLFAIATYVNSFLMVFAIPSLTACVGMLYLDRHYRTAWFNPAHGGDPVIWQHLFWFFGHPEVYILILPAFGIMSEVVPVFSRKPLFGRTSMVIMLSIIGLLSFLVWAHHMFTTGLPSYFNAIMAATSMLIAIPTGVKIFNWLGTMWGGALRFTTSLTFACGMIATFVIGGVTGVAQASVPFDWQMNDSFFIVAHLHNVLFGGTLFAVFAGFYYWFPKMSGRMLSERLGKWHFWVILVGFLLTYMPMYALGIMGMPRREYTYAPNLGWNQLNLISAIGGFTIGVALIIFFVNVFRSLRDGEVAGDNPWGGWTLEWATTSPPPPNNFASPPSVTSDLPLWDVQHTAGAGGVGATPPAPAAEPLSHTAEAAEAGHFTVLPFATAMCLLVIGIGLLTTLGVVVLGVGLLLIVSALWMSPRWQAPPLAAVQGQRFSALGAGMLTYLGSEVVLFGALIAAYIHLRVHNNVLSSPSGLHLTLPDVNTVILLSSGIFAHYMQASHRKGKIARFYLLLVVTVVLGAIFLGGQAWEYTHVGFGLSGGLRATGFFTITGLHGLHVAAGIIMLVYLVWRVARTGRGADSAPAPAATYPAGTSGMVDAVTYYWHFVDLVWIAIFAVVYLL